MAIASWLTPASKSGTGNKTVGLTASKNPGASRTTIVTVTVSGITKTVNCTQTEQDKFTLKVSSTTLNSSGTAITNIGECSIGSTSSAGVSTGTYYRDTSQTITAKAAPTGYSFVGWYEGSNLISSSLQVSVTMSANRTLVAKYQIKSYVVNAVSDDTTKGTVSPAGQTIEHGKNVTVTASRKTGYKFDGWYNGTTKVTSANPYTFAPTANITLTAKWSIYNITIPVNVSPIGAGTTSPSPFTGQEGSSVYITATPATGYKFAYWTDGVDDTHYTNNPQSVVMLSVKTLTAYFTLKSYTVTWNANGGTVSPASTTKTHGSTLGTLPTPTRASTAEYSYTFAGWFTAANGGTQISSTTTVTGNVTYYAHWTATKRSYTATFNGNGGGTPSPSTITKEYNTALGTLPTVSRTGYTFVGWFDTSAASGGTQATTTTKVTGTKTWYARWSINSYTFTFDKNGGNTPSATTITKEYNTAIGTLPTCTRSADNTYTYDFAGWFDTSASSGGTKLTTTTKVISNKTWYARWTSTYKNYTVTWDGNGGTPSKSSSSFHYNDALGTLPTATRTGYTFKGWSTSKTGTVNVSTTTKVTANVTYYAVWTINSYTWTFDANGGTGDTTKTLNYNATLSTLPTASRASTAANNYTFAGWFDTDASTGGTQLTTSTKCTGNKTWYARWTISTRQYKLTVTAGTGGTVSGGGTYNYNASVTLKATANSGYHFVKWSDGNTSATRTVTVTKDATYTATFEQDPYLNLDKTSLEFEASGGTQTVNVTSNVSWTVS